MHDHETHDAQADQDLRTPDESTDAASPSPTADAESFSEGHAQEDVAMDNAPEGAVPFSEGEAASVEPEPAPDWAPERGPRNDMIASVDHADASLVILRPWPQDDGAQDRGTVRVQGAERSDVVAESPEGAKHPGRATIEIAEQAIVVTVDGDIDVHVPAGVALQVEGSLPGALEVADVRGELMVAGVGDSLSLSQTGAARVGRTGAHLSAEGIQGALHVDSVGAHASVGEVHGDLHMGRIGAHAKLRHVHGDVTVERVGGHAKLRDVHGDLTVERVGGHLKASEVHGAIRATAGGNAKLMLVGGQACQVKAGGNLKCHIAEGGGNEVSVAAGGGVKVDAPDSEIEVAGHQRRWQGVVGEGGPTVELKAGGMARLVVGGSARSFEGDQGGSRRRRGRREWRFETSEGDAWREVEADFERAASSAAEGAARMAGQFEQLAEQIASRVAEAVSGIERNLSDIDLGDKDVERLRMRMSNVGERFAERLESRLQRAVSQAARRGMRARVRSQRRRGSGSGPGWGGPPWQDEQDDAREWRRGPEGGEPTASRAVPGASGDEVMTILRMVEEKRISAEEAEKLIAALRRSG